ncbi:class I glutamine amidotransferase-like protein [Geopyxis carbonaria]|nr:class I glutamine amidotransferase-like protein [Geopyxis carbonaria]
MSSKPSVLFVLTSHKELGTTGKPTGWYLPEFAHPYHVLAPVTNITVASPAGGEAPLDPASVEGFKADAVSMDFLKQNEATWKETEKLSNFIGKVADFDAIFFVGGHGPMWDLSNSSDSFKLIREFAEADKIVSAVCHGPAALANVKLSDGSYLVNGHEVTAFTNVEEDQVGLTAVMPFLLESVLKDHGAVFVNAEKPWDEKVVVAKGGKLITGQNPASATGVGEAIKKALGL